MAKAKTVFLNQEEMNLKEIGTILDVSESRISQILSETAGKLRTLMNR